MKRSLFILFILGLLVAGNMSLPADAGFIAKHKAAAEQAKYEKDCKKEIRELFAKQDDYAKKYDLKALKTLYSNSFVDNDGYNKDVYFSLVKDTWNTYKDITYTTEITNIQLNGDYATVETTETAMATSDDINKAIFGELNSTSKCIYHLQRFSNKWEIIGETVLEEVSELKYGDARYAKISLEAPRMVGSGQEYTATLKVDLPTNNIIVASINQEKIVNPAKKPQEVYRKVNESGTLARVFNANTDNVNEYTVASVGITTVDAPFGGPARVHMSGLAFVMTRVNVVPKNNFARVDEPEGKDKNEQQTK